MDLGDPNSLREYLTRLEAFVMTLPESQNSLKATVLYQRLKVDLAARSSRSGAVYEVLALPRNSSYVNREYLSNSRPSRWLTTKKNYATSISIPPIDGDQRLVTHYLEQLFQADENYERSRNTLIEISQRVFATTRFFTESAMRKCITLS